MVDESAKKLIVVGDGQCGKTCLLLVFQGQEFIDGHVPTVFDTYVADVDLDGKTVTFALWDTAGQEDYDQLRVLLYNDTEVVLICFSVDSPDSLQNCMEKWSPEVSHWCPKTPRILVGLKTDLRTDEFTIDSLARQNKHPITTEEGKAAAFRINAQAYAECSAKANVGVRDVFVSAATIALAREKSNKNHCNCCTVL